VESWKRKGAAERARWLAELAWAIDEAQQLAWRIGVIEGGSTEALELYVRLEAARIEVEGLRGATHLDPTRPWPIPPVAAERVTSVPENP
jgi:hypothetical protein